MMIATAMQTTSNRTDVSGKTVAPEVFTELTDVATGST
jgi:hypothetical protein